MTRLLKAFIFLMSCATSASVIPQSIVIVVHQDSKIESLSKREVMDMYMGRSLYFPDGEKALTLDYESSASIKQEFYQKLVNRSVAQVNAYWARVIFTGKATPPYPLESADKVLSTVATNVSAIGYVYEDQIKGRVKIVAQLPDTDD